MNKSMAVPVLVLLLSSILPVAQATPSAFRVEEPFILEGIQSVPESYPFGPGDRSAALKVRMLAGENIGNVEYWVLYSDDKSLLTGAHIGSSFPHGKATLSSSSSGEIVARFIFPHSDKGKPNSSDVGARIFGSGKTVFYKWAKKKGSDEYDSQIVEFTMPDKLTIVNFGDSYASGEGAPYSSGPKWDSEISHRSGNSGQALAVKQFKLDHPDVAVAFKNVASSGAGIDNGIIYHQTHATFLQPDVQGTQIEPQIDQVRSWLRDNGYDTVNIALLSIGINEIGFGEIVQGYFIEPGNLVDDRNTRDNITTNINDLRGKYADLKGHFDAAFDYDHVLVSEYPDLTHDQHGHFNGRAEIHGLCWGPIESLNSPEAEYSLAYDIGRTMNDKIKSTVREFDKWQYGGPAMEDSKLHGLSNCEEPWFNTIGASLLNQGDVGGTWHPNRDGHREFVKPLILHDLNFLYRKLQTEALRDLRQSKKELAIAAAKRKIVAKQRLAQQSKVMLSAKIRPAPVLKPLPADILEKAQEASKKLTKLAGGEDNRMPDDNEKLDKGR